MTQLKDTDNKIYYKTCCRAPDYLLLNVFVVVCYIIKNTADND